MRLLAVAALCLTVLGGDQQPPITVAAAISLTDALTAAARQYASTGGGRVVYNFAASNVLARQIVNGAPVDIFISADEAQMDVVRKAGLIVESSKVDLLTNRLAVVVPNDRSRTLSSIRDLLDPAFKRIAIGDPAAVPAGVYARQYLEKEGLWAALEPRIVPTGSVRAALAAVESGAADAGIVYRSDAHTATRASVAWLVPTDRGPRIVYPAARIRTSRVPEGADRFLAFLASEPATRTFEQFGFSRLGQSR